MIENQYFDPFVVESIVQGYRMPTATAADKVAAAKELSMRGLNDGEIAERLCITADGVRIARNREVEPLPPLPEWCDNYEQEWPKCKAGHELTPDNYRERRNGRAGALRKECLMCRQEQNRRYDTARRRAKREWARRHRIELREQRETA